MDVSSVHWPGLRRKGPPPTLSAVGSKDPGGWNSRVVPRASPTANPRRHPRYRSTTIALPRAAAAPADSPARAPHPTRIEYPGPDARAALGSGAVDPAARGGGEQGRPLVNGRGVWRAGGPETATLAPRCGAAWEHG